MQKVTLRMNEQEKYGTWFKNLIITDKKMKLLVALATGMHNDKIVGWKVSTSKNTAVVLEPV